MKNPLILSSIFVLSTVFVGCSHSSNSKEVDQIQDTMKAHKSEFRSCYEKSPESKNKGGQVVTSFGYGADGKVTKASIKESTLNSPVTEECLLTTIKGIQFPQPPAKGSVEINYPFKFVPNKSAKE